MTEPFSSEEQGPVSWIGGRPVYAVHYLALVFAVSMVVTALVSAFNQGPLLAWLAFASPEVLRGQLWRIFTYGLVNSPSIWFALELLMLVWFGQEVEKFFGRRKFFGLYACLYAIPPLLFTLFGLWRATALVGESASFAVFVAFATVYPNAQILFSLLAKWVAGILLAVYALQYLGSRDWLGLGGLLATSGFAYGFVLWQMGRLRLWPAGLLARKSPARPRRETPARRETGGGAPSDRAAQEMDALLDKISHSGIHSLSAGERAKLDALREKLRRKSGR